MIRTRAVSTVALARNTKKDICISPEHSTDTSPKMVLSQPFLKACKNILFDNSDRICISCNKKLTEENP